jgi:hypothetical protein
MRRLLILVLTTMTELVGASGCDDGGDADADGDGDSDGDAERLAPEYAAAYELVDLGAIPVGPRDEFWPGDIAVPPDDPDRLLIADMVPTDRGGGVYSIDLVRGADQHIQGFTGQAELLFEAGYAFALEHGPDDVLFVGYSQNSPEGYTLDSIGVVLPGSEAIDSSILVSSFVELEDVSDGDVTGLAVEPGSTQLKAAVINTVGDALFADWCSLDLASDGSGGFGVAAGGVVRSLDQIPGGMAYVPPGSPLFAERSVLFSEYLNMAIVTYETDENGDPLVETRRLFLTGVNMPNGAAIDAPSGDFLFAVADTSADGSTDEVHLLAVRGFSPLY